MGLDVGNRRIGVALSDLTGVIASPYKTLHRTHLSKDIETLVSWITANDVIQLVVGWPLESSGRPGRQAKKVKIVTDALLSTFEIPLILWDERMTTIIAKRSLIEAGTRRAARKQVVDKVAASLILQSWLDAD